MPRKVNLKRVNTIRAAMGLRAIPTDRRAHRRTGPHSECDCLYCNWRGITYDTGPTGWRC